MGRPHLQTERFWGWEAEHGLYASTAPPVLPAPPPAGAPRQKPAPAPSTTPKYQSGATLAKKEKMKVTELARWVQREVSRSGLHAAFI